MRFTQVIAGLLTLLSITATAEAERLRVKAARAEVRAQSTANAPLLKSYLSADAVEKVPEGSGVAKPSPTPWWAASLAAPSPAVKPLRAELSPARMAIPLTPRSLGPAPRKTKPPEKAATPQASNGLEARQFSMTLLGLVAPTKIDVDKSMSFEQNVEMGSLAASHPYETGFGGEVGIRYLFRENMGIQASLSFLSRDGSADFTARLPHPFFFDQHREVEGHVDTVSYHEIAVPVDFVYQRSVVKITYAVFAGASFFNVKADVVGVPQYVESYPFDIVTVTNVPVVNSSKSAVGFNVGGDVSYWVSDRLDVGVRLRFSRAKADLGTVGSTVEVNAGGFVAGAGLSVRF